MKQIRVLFPVLTACLCAGTAQACPWCAFDDLFTSMRHEFATGLTGSVGSTWRETPEQIIVQLKLDQGIESKDVQVTCDKNRLQVRIDKKVEKKAAKPAKKHEKKPGKKQATDPAQILRQAQDERVQDEIAISHSAYHLASNFQLPDYADTKNPANITATLNAAGTLLTITVPKKELPKVTVTQEKGTEIPVAQETQAAPEKAKNTHSSEK